MTFLEMLGAAEQRNQSLLCVGLDPDVTRLPAPFAGDATRIFDFCAAIVDATADVALAYKPQIAYFAANRAETQLEQLVSPRAEPALREQELLAQGREQELHTHNYLHSQYRCRYHYSSVRSPRHTYTFSSVAREQELPQQIRLRVAHLQNSSPQRLLRVSFDKVLF